MKTAVIALAFFVGFLFCLKYRHRDLVEGFDKVAVKKDLYYPERMMMKMSIVRIFL